MTAHHVNPPISVSAVVLAKDDGAIALVRKQDTAAFIFPGGKPEAGETGVHTAVREVAEELGVTLDEQRLFHLGDFTTPAANEADTQLHSQVYAARVPAGATVAAQAEIAELRWVTPGDLPSELQLAPLSGMILAHLAQDELAYPPLEMSLEAFEELVGDELDGLPDEIVNGLENLVFAVEDRPEDGELNLLGVYEGHDLGDRADYGYAQLPDRIVLFREPLLAYCRSVQELHDEVHVTLVHEIAHYYGIDDAHLHELGWA